jgi:hypothetical protein
MNRRWQCELPAHPLVIGLDAGVESPGEGFALLNCKGSYMTKLLLSAMMILGFQMARAEEPAPAVDTAPASVASESDPAVEKSFFETRTFEDVQDMVQSLTAADDTTAKTGG